MVKDKTGGERQSRLRLARSKWLKEHGFNSAEGLLGALMRGEVALQVVSVPTQRAGGRLKLVRVYEESEVEEVSVGEYRLKNRRR